MAELDKDALDAALRASAEAAQISLEHAPRVEAIIRAYLDAARQDTTITNNTGSDFVVENAYFERVGNAWKTADGWLPMESAPRDGTVILAAIEVRNTTGRKWWGRHVISFDECRNEIDLDYDHGWSWDDYTHWMPLPTPPEGE